MKYLIPIRHLIFLAATAVALGGGTNPAEASNGVVEINEFVAAQGGVTPGDAAGLPVTINLPGSYRLTSNLAGARAIDINAEDVTLDLNGFTLDGTAGNGPVLSGALRTRVRNGTVANTSFAAPTSQGYCVDLGNQSSVIDVVTQKCKEGIRVGAFSMVLRSASKNAGQVGVRTGDGSRLAAVRNEVSGNIGIATGNTCIVTDSISRASGAAGISMAGGSVLLGSHAVGGSSTGASIGSRSVASGNNFSSNATGLVSGVESVVQRSAASNNSAGFHVLARGVIREVTASGNSGDGIFLQHGSAGIHNVSSANTGASSNGFECDPFVTGAVCGLVGNTAIDNGANGIRMNAGAPIGTYKDSTLNGNGAFDVTPAGLNGGAAFQNYCSGAVCP